MALAESDLALEGRAAEDRGDAAAAGSSALGTHGDMTSVTNGDAEAEIRPAIAHAALPPSAEAPALGRSPTEPGEASDAPSDAEGASSVGDTLLGQPEAPGSVGPTDSQETPSGPAGNFGTTDGADVAQGEGRETGLERRARLARAHWSPGRESSAHGGWKWMMWAPLLRPACLCRFRTQQRVGSTRGGGRWDPGNGRGAFIY